MPPESLYQSQPSWPPPKTPLPHSRPFFPLSLPGRRACPGAAAQGGQQHVQAHGREPLPALPEPAGALSDEGLPPKEVPTPKGEMLGGRMEQLIQRASKPFPLASTANYTLADQAVGVNVSITRRVSDPFLGGIDGDLTSKRRFLLSMCLPGALFFFLRVRR